MAVTMVSTRILVKSRIDRKDETPCEKEKQATSADKGTAGHARFHGETAVLHPETVSPPRSESRGVINIYTSKSTLRFDAVETLIELRAVIIGDLFYALASW